MEFVTSIDPFLGKRKSTQNIGDMYLKAMPGSNSAHLGSGSGMSQRSPRFANNPYDNPYAQSFQNSLAPDILPNDMAYLPHTTSFGINQ